MGAGSGASGGAVRCVAAWRTAGHADAATAPSGSAPGYFNSLARSSVSQRCTSAAR